MESEKPIPEGWGSVPLNQLVSPSKEKVEPADDPDAFYIGLEHIEPNTTRIIGHGFARDTKSTKTRFFSGSILYGKLRPYLNKVSIPDFDGVCSTDILVFPPIDAVDTCYLMRFLSTSAVVDFATHQSSGMELPRTNYQKLGQLQVPLPPIAEQRRIVARLEALLADVERVRGRLEAVAATMQRFRQAVLESVFNGKITIGRGETSEPWTLVSIADVCEAIVDCPHSTPKWVTSGEICIRTSNFKPGRIDLSDTRYVSIETYLDRISRLEPKSGDILLSREGGILGVACMVPQGLKLCLGQRMMLLRVNESRYSSELLMHLLNAPPIQAVIKNMTGGTSSPHLNVGDVKRFQIPLPPLLEQHEIVRRVEALFALADRIEGEVATARKRVEALTQAVLAKAFRGELVPTEAELARREGREYEPAGVLLERVQAEQGRPRCR